MYHILPSIIHPKQWHKQEYNVLHLQEKLHAHEKEMQLIKLQQEKDLLLGENVVPLQKEVLEEKQRDELHAEEQREDDADLSFFLYLIRNVNEEFF